MTFVYDEPAEACARRGHTEALKILLEAGAKLEHTTKYEDNTLLILAARNGHTQTVHLLVKYGADLTRLAKNDFSALMYAVEGDYKSIVDALISAMKEAGLASTVYDTLVNRALIRAAQLGHAGVLKCLIEAGGNVNYFDEFMGDYPLTLAAPDVETVSLLLKHGGDVHKKGCIGRSPLHNAAQHNQSNSAIPLLVKAGAKINSLDNSQRTPLMLASYYGDIENVKHLIELKAEINYMDYAGMRAIHLAAERTGDCEGDVCGILKVSQVLKKTYLFRDHSKTSITLSVFNSE